MPGPPRSSPASGGTHFPVGDGGFALATEALPMEEVELDRLGDISGTCKWPDRSYKEYALLFEPVG